MDSDSTAFSDFCFLGRQEMRELKELVIFMHRTREEFVAQLRAGNDTFQAIQSWPIMRPSRNPSQPKEQYDNAMYGMVGQQLERMDKALQQKWENCFNSCEHLLDYVGFRSRAQEVLRAAAAKTPGSDAIFRLKEAANMQPESRQALNELHTELTDFTQMPLQDQYVTYSKLLNEMTVQIDNMKKSHAVFLAGAKGQSAEELHEGYLKFRRQTRECEKQMNLVARPLGACIINIPDPKAAFDRYEHGIASHRMQG